MRSNEHSSPCRPLSRVALVAVSWGLVLTACQPSSVAPRDTARASSHPAPVAEPRTARATGRSPLPTPGGRSRRPSATEAGVAAERPVAAVAPAATPARALEFPPAPLAPPHERSAQPGDGQWQLLDWEGRRGSPAPSPIAQTVLHPHSASRFLSVTIAVADLDRVRLSFVPGTEDATKEDSSAEYGLVPEADRASLLAIFNGGFQRRHGHWGMVAAGTVLTPLREGACSLVAGAGGRLELGALGASPEPPPDVEFIRQTPPCLLDGGRLHPRLASVSRSLWGGQNSKRKTRRRSAVGLDEQRRRLYYALGVEVEADLLAQALQWAGAQDAAQLDINWNWTKFLLVGDRGEGPRVVEPLVEGMEYPRSGYVRRAEPRDFFYLTLRSEPPR